MASSRRLPVSYNESTYGNATRDYTSLAAWEADTDNDLVSAGKGEVLECYADSISFDDTVTLDGAATNSSYFRVIKPAAGEKHNGTPSTGVKFSRSSTSDIFFFTIYEAYSSIYDLVMTGIVSSPGKYLTGIRLLGNYQRAVGNIIYDSSAPHTVGGITANNMLNPKVVNNLVFNLSSPQYTLGIRLVANSKSCTGYFYNNTVDSVPDAYVILTASGYTGTVYSKNNIATNYTNAFCSTGDGAEVWNHTTDVTSGMIYVDSANDDYHLASTDTAAKDQGTDLSSDSVFAFDDDIDGDTRSGSWDIGCDEYVESGPVTKTKTVNLDAMLQSTGLATASVDALISAINLDALDLDALIQQSGVSKTALLDALLKKTETAPIAMDAILQEPATSSRRLPTAYNVKTYGDATRDYTSLAAWESDTDNDLVTAAKGEVLECYADSTSFNDSVDMAGATTSADYFRVIKPAAGQGHDGTASTGVKFTGTNISSVTYRLSLAEDYSQFQDLVVTATFNIAAVAACIFIKSTNSTTAAVGCIAYGASNASSTSHGIRIDDSGVCINCLAYDCGDGGAFYASSDSDVGYFYNCTAANSAKGFWQGSAQNTFATNCISEDCTYEWYGAWTRTTCTNDYGVAFKDQVNRDYHLASNDTAAKGQGTDLSNDSVYAFDDDIDGEKRAVWDIGADAYCAVVTQSVSVDALISAINLDALDLDALVARNNNIVLAAIDACLQKKESRTAAIDALLQAAGMTSATFFDALLQAAGNTLTTSLDASIINGLHINVFIDAILQQSGIPKTALLDALLAQPGVSSMALLDAMVLRSHAKTALLDALLKKTETAPIAMDALVQKVGQFVDTSLDALVAKNDNIVSVVVDACLKKEQSRAATLDALIQVEGLEVSGLMDALLVAQRPHTTTFIDAWIASQVASITGMDAVIRPMGYTLTAKQIVEAESRRKDIAAMARAKTATAVSRIKEVY